MGIINLIIIIIKIAINIFYLVLKEKQMLNDIDRYLFKKKIFFFKIKFIFIEKLFVLVGI